MNWKSRSSDRPPQAEDEGTLRLNRRYLRRGSEGARRPGRVRLLAARFGPRFRRGAELVVLIMAALMLGQTVWREVPRALRLRYFQITGLIVEGNRRVTTTAIIDSLGLPAHVSILEVDLKALAGQIVRNPWIKTASVSRRLPASLIIHVSERTPRAAILAGRAYLVSDDGLILSEAGAEEIVGLPLLRVKAEEPLAAGKRIDISRLEQGARLWEQFRQHTLGPGMQAREIRLEGDGSCTVLLGDGLPYLRFREDVLRWQMDRLARVLEIRGIGLRELEYADLRFADKVIVKPLPRGGGA